MYVLARYNTNAIILISLLALTANPHTSQVDLREWEQDSAVRAKYPKMQHATKYTAVLRPGDS